MRTKDAVAIGITVVLVGIWVSHLIAARNAASEPRLNEWRARHAVLERASVFVAHPPDIATLDLTRTPNDPAPLDPDKILECRYQTKPAKGTAPKFDCTLENGDVIKVKYGSSNEVHGEVAASRLLAALGFGADHMTIVKRVRCHGCPPSPFRLRQLTDWFYASSLLERTIDFSHSRDFVEVAVERKFEGHAVEVGVHEGWQYADLAAVNASKGGASRAELDALRLVSVLIAHWDNKSSNQRLVCLDEDAKQLDKTHNIAACRSSLVMLQDVGSTFGPTKVNYENWTQVPIWGDAATCLATMDSLPYGGATFEPVKISEAGRQLLAGKLRQLSEKQLLDLFTAAKFPEAATGRETGNGLMPWVRTFQEKARQIIERPSCPE